MKNIINKIFLFLFLYLLAINLHNRINVKTTNHHLYFNFLRVKSDSMVPTLKPNDFVITVPIKNCKHLKVSQQPHHLTNHNIFQPHLEQGDIIVFQKKDVFNHPHNIIHRVISHNHNTKTLTTLGDNNDNVLALENNITYEEVLGKHVLTIRWWYLLTFMMMILLIPYFYQKTHHLDEDKP